MSAVDIATIAAAAFGLMAFGWGIFIWVHGRREKPAESADNVAVFIERGPSLEDGLSTWNVTAENRGRQPISDVTVIYAIRAWKPLPRTEGQVGQRFATGPWLGPHKQPLPLIRPHDKSEQAVFWEGPVDEVSGPQLLGAKFKDATGRLWVRGRDEGWREVTPDHFRAFAPDPPSD
jgi:hypothetical protein